MTNTRTCRVCGKSKPLHRFPKTSKIYRMHTCKLCFNKQRSAEHRNYRKIVSAIGISYNIYNKKYSVPCSNCNTKDKPLKYYNDIGMVLCETCRINLDRVCGSIKEMVIA